MHFYIYSSNGIDTTKRVRFDSVDYVEVVLADVQCPRVMFVTRYDTDEEYEQQRDRLDAIVVQLRERYQ